MPKFGGRESASGNFAPPALKKGSPSLSRFTADLLSEARGMDRAGRRFQFKTKAGGNSEISLRK